jgi:hypothetical protein
MRPPCSFFTLSLPTIRVHQLQSAFDWSHEMEGRAGLFLMSPIVATDEQTGSDVLAAKPVQSPV